ncbi:MAG: hypothetical protein M3R36_14535 [Bacteroidota bacterium]|nr:hypothetical protein [Bacteroidota bacterium]
MTATKLKNIIAKKISEVEDINILISINQIFELNNTKVDLYKLNDIQRKRIKKSQLQFKEGKTISNEKGFDDIEKWLEKKLIGQ